MRDHSWRLGAALLALLAASLVHAQGAAGTKWRVTTSMSGMGMALPSRTMEVCSTGAHQDQPPPAAQNGNCSFTEVSRSGNTVRYAMRCSGREAMQGQGEVTYGADRYHGNFKMRMSQGEMAVTYEGQKLGACDGTEVGSPARTDAMRQRIAEQQTSIQQSMAQGCMMEARSGSSPYAFLDPMKTGTVRCADPAARQAYCASFQTYKPFLAQQQMEEGMSRGAAGMPMSTPFTDSLKLCGVRADEVRLKLCSQAEQGVERDPAEAESEGSTEFLTKQCPTRSQAIAARECAGRSYTTVSARFRSFCAVYASSHPVAASAANAPSRAPGGSQASSDQGGGSNAGSLQDKAKSALKGLFGR